MNEYYACVSVNTLSQRERERETRIRISRPCPASLMSLLRHLGVIMRTANATWRPLFASMSLFSQHI